MGFALAAGPLHSSLAAAGSAPWQQTHRDACRDSHHAAWRGALTPSGNIFGDCSCYVDSSNNTPECFPWVEGNANRGIPKTPAWHCKFGCNPICRARRAQQSIPETPEIGQSHCHTAGTANATRASSWQPKLHWEMGAGGGRSAGLCPPGRMQEGIAGCLALGHAEGSGADVCKLFDQKGL